MKDESLAKKKSYKFGLAAFGIAKNTEHNSAL
jgi:hypothetical protein